MFHVELVPEKKKYHYIVKTGINVCRVVSVSMTGLIQGRMGPIVIAYGKCVEMGPTAGRSLSKKLQKVPTRYYLDFRVCVRD